MLQAMYCPIFIQSIIFLKNWWLKTILLLSRTFEKHIKMDVKNSNNASM